MEDFINMKKYKIMIKISRKFIENNYIVIPDSFVITKIIETDFDLYNKKIMIIINGEIYSVNLDWEKSHYILDDNYIVVHENCPIFIMTKDLEKIKEDIEYLMKHGWKLIHE